MLVVSMLSEALIAHLRLEIGSLLTRCATVVKVHGDDCCAVGERLLACTFSAAKGSGIDQPDLSIRFIAIIRLARCRNVASMSFV